MKWFLFVTVLLAPAVAVMAQDGSPGRVFTWDLLVTGSWEESKTLHNRGDIRVGLIDPAMTLRAQALDRRPLNFELDQPWGKSANTSAIASFGLYHKPTGSRLLYGILDEWGLPARIRSPWIRSAPYAENRKPVIADLRTTVVTTKVPEAYLYLSSPRIDLFQDSVLPMALRGFASAQLQSEGDIAPAFSAGLDIGLGKKYALMLEGFYTGAELPAKESSSWFSDPPPLPVRDFRLGAAALMFTIPYMSLSSDWAWSETFAYGNGVYGNLGIRLYLPRSWAEMMAGTKPGPWSVSLAADGMTDRYVGRDGTSPAAGFRTAGKVEWKGQRSSLFRANTLLRSPGLEEPFNRSSTGLYYRFPALSARASEAFPLHISRVSLNTDRNASDLRKIADGIDASLGLSLSLPPMVLPAVFLPRSSAKTAAKPKSYPLGINFSTSVDWLGWSEDAPAPYPFFPAHQEFDSAKATCELIWSPGIFQFRTRWGYTSYAKKDDLWEASFSTAVRFSHGRFSVRVASPAFPDKWNCTLSWRLEK